MRSSTRAPARTTRLEAARRRREKRGFDQPTAREAGSGVNGCIFLGIHCYTLGAHRMHVSTREEHSLRALPPLSAILTVAGPTGACTSRHKIYIAYDAPPKSQVKSSCGMASAGACTGRMDRTSVVWFLNLNLTRISIVRRARCRGRSCAIL